MVGPSHPISTMYCTLPPLLFLVPLVAIHPDLTHKASVEGMDRLNKLVHTANTLQARNTHSKPSLSSLLKKSFRSFLIVATTCLAVLLLATGQTAFERALKKEQSQLPLGTRFVGSRMATRFQAFRQKLVQRNPHSASATIGGVTDGADEVAMLQVVAERAEQRKAAHENQDTAGAEDEDADVDEDEDGVEQTTHDGKIVGPLEQVRIVEGGKCVQAHACSSLRRCAAEGANALATRKLCMNYLHMLMLAELPDRRLAAAWQASAVVEGAEDQRIFLAVSQDTGGRTWGTPTPLPDETRRGAQWSPVLHYDSSANRLHIFYAESDAKCVRSSRTHGGRQMPRRFSVGGHIMHVSRDVGDDPATEVSWTEPRTLLSQEVDGGIPKVVANRLTVLSSSGHWVLPFWRQRSWGVCETKDLHNTAGVLLSKDGGETFEAFGEIHLNYKTHWVIEGSVAEMKNGTLLMLMRSSDNFIFHSTSRNGGMSWTNAVPTSIPNPDSKIAMLGASNVLLLAYNDLTRAFTGMAKGRDLDSKKRDRLKLAVSSDDGSTWVDLLRLDDETPKLDGDVPILYHYPTMVVRAGSADDDGDVKRKTRVLVGYSRAYVDREEAVKRSATPKALQDGLWLTEIELNSYRATGVVKLVDGRGEEAKPIGRTFELFDSQPCATAGCATAKRSRKEAGNSESSQATA